jgi:hypothetical protein
LKQHIKTVRPLWRVVVVFSTIRSSIHENSSIRATTVLEAPSSLEKHIEEVLRLEKIYKWVDLFVVLVVILLLVFFSELFLSPIFVIEFSFFLIRQDFECISYFFKYISGVGRSIFIRVEFNS